MNRIGTRSSVQVGALLGILSGVACGTNGGSLDAGATPENPGDLSPTPPGSSGGADGGTPASSSFLVDEGAGTRKPATTSPPQQTGVAKVVFQSLAEGFDVPGWCLKVGDDATDSQFFPLIAPEVGNIATKIRPPADGRPFLLPTTAATHGAVGYLLRVVDNVATTANDCGATRRIVGTRDFPLSGLNDGDNARVVLVGDRASGDLATRLRAATVLEHPELPAPDTDHAALTIVSLALGGNAVEVGTAPLLQGVIKDFTPLTTSTWSGSEILAKPEPIFLEVAMSDRVVVPLPTVAAPYVVQFRDATTARHAVVGQSIVARNRYFSEVGENNGTDAVVVGGPLRPGSANMIYVAGVQTQTDPLRFAVLGQTVTGFAFSVLGHTVTRLFPPPLVRFINADPTAEPADFCYKRGNTWEGPYLKGLFGRDFKGLGLGDITEPIPLPGYIDIGISAPDNSFSPYLETRFVRASVGDCSTPIETLLTPDYFAEKSWVIGQNAAGNGRYPGFVAYPDIAATPDSFVVTLQMVTPAYAFYYLDGAPARIEVGTESDAGTFVPLVVETPLRSDCVYDAADRYNYVYVGSTGSAACQPTSLGPTQRAPTVGRVVVRLAAGEQRVLFRSQDPVTFGAGGRYAVNVMPPSANATGTIGITICSPAEAPQDGPNAHLLPCKRVEGSPL